MRTPTPQPETGQPKNRISTPFAILLALAKSASGPLMSGAALKPLVLLPSAYLRT